MTLASAAPAMTAGMSGTTATLASGATSETCPNVASSTGRVASCAATVRATGVRIQAGHRSRRPSIGAPSTISPPVARADSWNPTSHRAAGVTRSMTSTAPISAEAAWAGDPASRATTSAPAMSAARTTAGEAPTSTT